MSLSAAGRPAYTALGMAGSEPPDPARYARQVAFGALGEEGQRRLRLGRALIVGVGGLGSWTAEILARAGVGLLRLADDDVVERGNLHRQALYDEDDAAGARPKALAAAARLRKINADVRVEPAVERVDAGTIARLADGVGVILDGTDNFAARFLINDYAVKHNRPWVFTGVVGAEGQVMPILPGRTPCLRCLYDCPPSAHDELAPRALGVLGPAVAALAAAQAAEALKILAGRLDAVRSGLTKLDLWRNTSRRLDAGGAAGAADCVCCKQRRFEYLEPAAGGGGA